MRVVSSKQTTVAAEDLLAAHFMPPQVRRDTTSDARQGFAETEHAIVFRFVADFPPAGVIAEIVCLRDAHRGPVAWMQRFFPRANPDIGPGWAES